jgi:hypothetical protein
MPPLSKIADFLTQNHTFRKDNIMRISLLSHVNGTTYRIKDKVLPLVVESLENTNYVDYAYRKSLISKLQDKGYFSPGEHVVMSISIDPKKCKIPFEYCSADCNDGCDYNPLKSLYKYHLDERQFVITHQDTIDLLLDSIILLAKANKNALMREQDSD